MVPGSTYVSAELWKRINDFNDVSSAPICCELTYQDVEAGSDPSITECWLSWRPLLFVPDLENDVKSAASVCDNMLHALPTQPPAPNQRACLWGSVLNGCSSDKFVLALSLCSSIEATIFQLLGLPADVSNGLLRQALFDPKLCIDAASPLASAAGIQFLRFLFLPDGLNIRNLSWHGFLSPSALDDRYLALFIILHQTLIRELCRQQPTPVYERTLVLTDPVYRTSNFFSDPSCCEDFMSATAETSALNEIKTMKLKDVELLMENSFLFGPNHQDRIEQILSAVQDCRTASSMVTSSTPSCDDVKMFRATVWKALLKVIPILEQQLRIIFCIVNAYEDSSVKGTKDVVGGDHNIYVMRRHLIAQKGSYYTTLDGFGQRSKHQLLLDPMLVHLSTVVDQSFRSSSDFSDTGCFEKPVHESSGRRNCLPQYLGPDIYGLLIDLFLADRGANVRALLAHCDVLKRIYSGGSHHPDMQDEGKPVGWRVTDPDRVLLRTAELLVAVVVQLCSRFQVVPPEASAHSKISRSMSCLLKIMKRENIDEALDTDPVETRNHSCASGRYITAVVSSEVGVRLQYKNCYHPSRLMSDKFLESLVYLSLLNNFIGCRLVRGDNNGLRDGDLRITVEPVINRSPQGVFRVAVEARDLREPGWPWGLSDFNVFKSSVDAILFRFNQTFDVCSLRMTSTVNVFDKYAAVESNFQRKCVQPDCQTGATNSVRRYDSCLSEAAQQVTFICGTWLSQIAEGCPAFLLRRGILTEWETDLVKMYLYSLQTSISCTSAAESNELNITPVYALLLDRMSLLSVQSICGCSSWLKVLQV
jgi:hypothetical protein